MFTQLSLFDLPGLFDAPSAPSPVVSLSSPGTGSPDAVVAPAGCTTATEATSAPVQAAAAPQPVAVYGDARRGDSIQPMGDLARLVLARYEMVARRRQEMMRRKAAQPRQSIRVLSPS